MLLRMVCFFSHFLIPDLMAFSILLIEDERLVAENIATILKEASYENISIVSKRKEAINFYQENEVILIISDINLYGQHEGPLIVKELLTLRKCPVIYLTAYSDQQILEDALETEPSAYVLKPFTERQLLVAVKMALREQESAIWAENLQKPSVRELEIIRYLAEGMNSKEIAKRLFISEHTVRTHRRNMLKKLGLGSSSELTALSIKLKWISV